MIPLAVNAAVMLQRLLPQRLPMLLNGLDNPRQWTQATIE